MKPWPTTYTFWAKTAGEPPLRLILDAVSVVSDTDATSAAPTPGQIVVARGDRLLAATGQGLLAIERIQPAGKRVLSTAEFLRGYPLRPGQAFE